MIIRTKTAHTALVLTIAVWPAYAPAQVAEACGRDDSLLMYCTVEGGARTLNLCLSGEVITYAFGPTNGAPTLEMIRDFQDVEYDPSVDEDGTIREQVTLFNGNYGYEMFTESRQRVDPVAIAEGGIIVRLPDGQTQTLICDAGTVAPDNPFDGIGQLAQLSGDGQEDPLGFCLARLGPDTPAATCLGRQRDIDITAGLCDPASDATDCWGSEATVWDTLIETRFAAAIADLKQTQTVDFIETLEVAQGTWAISRNLDCQVYGPNPFAADAGQAQCLAQYTADRVTFLQDLISFAEFDG
ncbi:lysozyme inhibitor LprI family protein [Yoonia sp. 2307UL14-13]|uniref:lysozyme inhibitor LprI family protein n=1 Tax=Yoonia sp. 2307UL14-13 TaxID=3126506 RepID=UPI0030B51B90